MNPEIKAKWLADLESGDYPKGKRALRSINDEYCCLGVLCEQAVEAEIIERSRIWRCYAYGNTNGNSTSFLPEPVAKWAGINRGDAHNKLIDLNDSSDTFEPVIAEIRENF